MLRVRRHVQFHSVSHIRASTKTAPSAGIVSHCKDDSDKENSRRPFVRKIGTHNVCLPKKVHEANGAKTSSLLLLVKAPHLENVFVLLRSFSV